MTITTYTYPVSQTLNNIVNKVSLEQELRLHRSFSNIFLKVELITIDSIKNIAITLLNAITDEELSYLNFLISNHSGKPTKKFDFFNNTVVSLGPSTGALLNMISQDMSNKQTWIEHAERINNTVMVGSGTTYNLPTPEIIINMVNGKMSEEDYWVNYFKETKNLDLVAEVKVDGVKKIEKTLDNIDGDFILDYKTGQVIFDSSQSGTVEISYARPTISDFYLKPDPGKIIAVQLIEIQIGKSVEMRDTVHFDVFEEKGKSPRLEFIDVPNGTLINVGNKTYKRMVDFINESDYCYPVFKTPGPRGLPEDGYVYGWNHQKAIVLPYSYGAFLRIRLKNNNVFTIEQPNPNNITESYSTCTFYGSSENE